MHPILTKKSTVALIAIVAILLGSFVAYAGLSGDIFATALIRGAMVKQPAPRINPPSGTKEEVAGCQFSRLTVGVQNFDGSLIQEQVGGYGRTFVVGPIENGSGCNLYGVTVEATIGSVGRGSHSEGDIYIGASRGAFNLPVSFPAYTPAGSGTLTVSISGCLFNTLGGSVACPAGSEFTHSIDTGKTVSWRPLPPTCTRAGCSSAQWVCYDLETNGSTTCSNYNIPGSGRTCVSCNPPPTVCNLPAQACQPGIAPNSSNGLECFSDTGVAGLCRCPAGQQWDDTPGQMRCRVPTCGQVCQTLPNAGGTWSTDSATVPPNAEPAAPDRCSGWYFGACMNKYRWQCKPGHGFNASAGRCECDNPNLRNQDGSCRPAPAVCGNGILEDGEQCDDRNLVNTDACTNACKHAVCGDTIVRTGVEQCDDGNAVNNDGCTNDCRTVCVPGTMQCGTWGGWSTCSSGARTRTRTCSESACGTSRVETESQPCCDGTNRPDGCSCSNDSRNCASGFCRPNDVGLQVCAPNQATCTASSGRPDGCACSGSNNAGNAQCASGNCYSYVCQSATGSTPTPMPSPSSEICGPAPYPNPCFTDLGYRLACVGGTWLCQYGG